MNGNGELFIRRHPQLKVKLVDGSSLAVAVVLNSIPKGTTQVSVRGNLSKVSSSVAIVLCQRGIQVLIPWTYLYLNYARGDNVLVFNVQTKFETRLH